MLKMEFNILSYGLIIIVVIFKNYIKSIDMIDKVLGFEPATRRRKQDNASEG